MRWTNRSRTDIRSVTDKYQIYDFVISQLRTKMRGAGSPCTYYHNFSKTFIGTVNPLSTKCYCWNSQQGSPDRTHTLCMGTGYLEGYQKYGYNEDVISIPSPVTKDTAVIVTGDRGSEFSLSGTALSGSITTQRLTLTRFLDIDRFYVTDRFTLNETDNRIRYFYSLNDTTWVPITMSSLTGTKLGTRKGVFTLPVGTVNIRFKITLMKKNVSSPSAAFNSIRFRYRNQKSLTAIDPYFSIGIPAFLAARDQQTIEVKQGAYGWETLKPLNWWTLPEVDINNSDVITFLQGEYEDQKYEVQNLIPSLHGPDLKLIHKKFQSSFIRDNNDVLKIVDLLT